MKTPEKIGIISTFGIVIGVLTFGFFSMAFSGVSAGDFASGCGEGTYLHPKTNSCQLFPPLEYNEFAVHINNKTVEYVHPDFIINEICSLTTEEPFYDCSEKWMIYYNPNTDHLIRDAKTIGGIALRTVPISIFLSNATDIDTCGQNILEHEFRHILEEDWDDSECYIDRKPQPKILIFGEDTLK